MMEERVESGEALPPPTANMTKLSTRDMSTILFSSPAPNTIVLRGNQYEVGRSIAADAMLHSLQISRKHCIFDFKDSKWWIKDTSTNGIEINETPIRKQVSTIISDGDIINLIPNGVLSYKFEYIPTVSKAEPQSAECTEVVIPEPEDSCSSDTGDSLLSIEHPDHFGSARDVNENDIEMTSNSASFQEMEPTGSTSKRALPLESEHNSLTSKIFSSVVATKKCVKSSSIFLKIPEDEDEELLDLQDEILTPAPQQKRRKSENESMDMNLNEIQRTNTPIKMSKPKAQQTLAEKMDLEILNTQLQYFISKCKDLETEKKLNILESTIERDKLKKDLTDARSEYLLKKINMFKDLSTILDAELNCCICNEVYIQATVIDCGHTFCHHCITEWIKKTSNCPVCRKTIINCVKQVELNNFILKIHSLFPLDTQEKRDQLLRDRDEEISVAIVVAQAESAEREEALARANVGDAVGGIRVLGDIAGLQSRLRELGDRVREQSMRYQRGNTAPIIYAQVAQADRRRSPRGRRTTQNPGDNIDEVIGAVAQGVGLPSLPRPQPLTAYRTLRGQGRRARRGAAASATAASAHQNVLHLSAAAGSPDLITLDDSQEQGPPIQAPSASGGFWGLLMG